MEEYLAALTEKTPLKELLVNDEWDRHFRSGLRSKDTQLLAYLSSREILGDMIQALVNEEDRTLQEASEALGVLLTNLDPVNDALVANHLEPFFAYLDRKTHNPRRMYFFLRLSSFIFQNKTAEALAYAIANQSLTQKLVKHLASPHIMQLILLILNLERQMKTDGQTTFDWSTKTSLIGALVDALKEDPQANLDAVTKFMQEICNHNDPTSEFVRSTITANNGGLMTVLAELTKIKSVSQDAIRLFDDHILKIIMINEANEEFYNATTKQLLELRPVFQDMLNSPSLMDVLSGVKIIHALIKHRAFFMLGDGLTTCTHLLFRFPWSNILHNAIVVIVAGIFLTEGKDEFILNLLESGLVRKIVTGLADPTPSGFKPHLRQIAASMQVTPSSKAQEYLDADPLWKTFWQAMEIRKNSELTYVAAEQQVMKELKEALDATSSDTPAAKIPEKAAKLSKEIPADVDAEKVETPAEVKAEASETQAEVPQETLEISETPETQAEISNQASETPETPVEIPKEAPETPIEAPKETPEAPVETPKEAPVEVPQEAPVEVPQEAPVETPQEAPVEIPQEAPVEIPQETPVETPKETPAVEANEAVVVPADQTTDVPAESPQETSADEKAEEAKTEAKEAPTENAAELS